MSGVVVSLGPQKRRQFVDPAVFAERIISHERLERADLPQDDLLGLRDMCTGETMFVHGAWFRRWLTTRE